MAMKYVYLFANTSIPWYDRVAFSTDEEENPALIGDEVALPPVVIEVADDMVIGSIEMTANGEVVAVSQATVDERNANGSWPPVDGE